MKKRMDNIVKIICPACEDKRVHTKDEYKTYHPLGGHGYTSEQGPTHLSIEDRRKKK